MTKAQLRKNIKQCKELIARYHAEWDDKPDSFTKSMKYPDSTYATLAYWERLLKHGDPLATLRKQRTSLEDNYWITINYGGSRGITFGYYSDIAPYSKFRIWCMGWFGGATVMQEKLPTTLSLVPTLPKGDGNDTV